MENLEEYAERIRNIKRKTLKQEDFIKKEFYFTDKQWNLITVFFGILLAVAMTVTVVVIVTKIFD